jgi:transposase-like protein
VPDAVEVLEEPKEFIAEWQQGEESMAELCRRHGVSQPTGYKWCSRNTQI